MSAPVGSQLWDIAKGYQRQCVPYRELRDWELASWVVLGEHVPPHEMAEALGPLPPFSAEEQVFDPASHGPIAPGEMGFGFSEVE